MIPTCWLKLSYKLVLYSIIRYETGHKKDNNRLLNEARGQMNEILSEEDQQNRNPKNGKPTIPLPRFHEKQSPNANDLHEGSQNRTKREEDLQVFSANVGVFPKKESDMLGNGRSDSKGYSSELGSTGTEMSVLQDSSTPEDIIKFLMKYTPRNKMITIDDLKKNPNTKVKRFKDCVFFGNVFNNKRHGLGIMLYKNGRIYEGEWTNDVKNGKGLEMFGNGGRYEGDFVNGKPEGYGVYVWPNGEVYDGQWLNGMKHGSGLWRGVHGDSYIGEWKFGKAEGYGVHTWQNGDRYEGEFKACLKHGQGTERFANGDHFTGNYENGRPYSYGEYYWKTGAVYKGNFKNGLRHGHGIWKQGNECYDGDYINDRKCGYGEYRWACGNIYKGQFFDDLRHGYGEMTWIDGSCYKGMWERGFQHGEGELSLPGKIPERGKFHQNVYVGVSNLPVDHANRLKLATEETITANDINSSIHTRNRKHLYESVAEERASIKSIPVRGRKFAYQSSESSNGLLSQENHENSTRSRNGYLYGNSKLPALYGRESSQGYSNTPGNSKDYSAILRLKQAYLIEDPKSPPPFQKKVVQKRAFGESPRIGTETFGYEAPQETVTEGKRHKFRRKGRKGGSVPPLTKAEIVKWNHFAEKMNFSPGMFGDFEAPTTVQKIRWMINPPVWKPAGRLKGRIGKTDLPGFSPQDQNYSLDHATPMPFITPMYQESKHNSFFY